MEVKKEIGAASLPAGSNNALLPGASDNGDFKLQLAERFQVFLRQPTSSGAIKDFVGDVWGNVYIYVICQYMSYDANMYAICCRMPVCFRNLRMFQNVSGEQSGHLGLEMLEGLSPCGLTN